MAKKVSEHDMLVTLVRKAARRGILRSLPKDMLTPEILLERGRDGYNALHIAAKSGKLNAVPRKFLSRYNIMATVDASAFNRLNVSYMRAISVFHVAAAYGHLDQIPRALVNRRNMEAHLRATGETIFHTAAQCDFKGVPSELMLEKNMQIPNSLGATVFHIAAAKGVLNHMPVGFLTESNMLKPDWEGSSVFHVAAQNGHIDQIPKELLTEQNMLRSDSNGDTVLHGLALRGELRKLPVSLLTERTLLASNAGATVLHVALKHDKLDQLLGLELPDKARNILGDAWYSANLAAVALKNPSSQEHAIDLF